MHCILYIQEERRAGRDNPIRSDVNGPPVPLYTRGARTQIQTSCAHKHTHTDTHVGTDCVYTIHYYSTIIHTFNTWLLHAVTTFRQVPKYMLSHKNSILIYIYTFTDSTPTRGSFDPPRNPLSELHRFFLKLLVLDLK